MGRIAFAPQGEASLCMLEGLVAASTSGLAPVWLDREDELARSHARTRSGRQPRLIGLGVQRARVCAGAAGGSRVPGLSNAFAGMRQASACSRAGVCRAPWRSPPLRGRAAGRRGDPAGAPRSEGGPAALPYHQGHELVLPMISRVGAMPLHNRFTVSAMAYKDVHSIPWPSAGRCASP